MDVGAISRVFMMFVIFMILAHPHSQAKSLHRDGFTYIAWSEIEFSRFFIELSCLSWFS